MESIVENVQTPWGVLAITSVAGEVVSADFLRGERVPAANRPAPDQSRSVQAQILSYLSDPTTRFTLALRLQGTEFQQKVWRALCDIPAGETMTYGELAKSLNSSARAIGNACRANPIPLIVPCHRVVSAQGIGGYSGAVAGENIDLKRSLLRHEGVLM